LTKSNVLCFMSVEVRVVIADNGLTYIWRFDLAWSHYWSCDRYDLAILTPSKKKITTFKEHDNTDKADNSVTYLYNSDLFWGQYHCW
jgi:hypothetical protein